MRAVVVLISFTQPSSIASDVVMSASRCLSPDPSIAPHSCHHCNRIIIKPPRKAGPHGYRCRLPHTRLEALDAARHGCPIFKLLLHGYLAATTRSQIRRFIQAVQGAAHTHFPRIGIRTTSERLIYFAESLSPCPFSIRFDEKGQALFACMGWASFWFTVNASPSTNYLT